MVPPKGILPPKIRLRRACLDAARSDPVRPGAGGGIGNGRVGGWQQASGGPASLLAFGAAAVLQLRGGGGTFRDQPKCKVAGQGECHMAKKQAAEKAAAAAAKLNAVLLSKNGVIVSDTPNPETPIGETPVTTDQQAAGIESAAAADDAAAEQSGSTAAETEAAEEDDDDEDDDEGGGRKRKLPNYEPKLTLSASEMYGLEQAVIDAAIEAGSLIRSGWGAKILGKDVTKTGRAEFAIYERLKATNRDGALILCKGAEALRQTLPKPEGEEVKRPKGVWDMFHYGFDLEATRPLRGRLIKAIQGPAKMIKEMADLMVLNKFPNPLTGQPFTQAEAEAYVKKSRADAGMDI